MMVTPSETDSIDFNELATLKRLALEGGHEHEVHVSCKELSGRLGVSAQTVSRRLRRLDETGHISRQLVDDGQQVHLTDRGVSTLREQYHEYIRMFETFTDVSLSGAVTDGMGEGQHYISLSGYQEQFRSRLGYEPFPGTLNVELDGEGVRLRERMEATDGVRIDEWSDEERTYGAATCYPVVVRSGGDTFEPAHVLEPDRTHHDDRVVEVIAPVKLREELAVDSGTEVRLDVTK